MQYRVMLFVLFLVACFSIPSAYAQQTLGTINGTVKDSSGASVSSAMVTATDEQTGLTIMVKSSNSGYFQILDLPIGTYTVSVKRDGFETEVLQHLTVVQEHALTVAASLKVGSTTESVTVTENPLLNRMERDLRPRRARHPSFAQVSPSRQSKHRSIPFL